MTVGQRFRPHWLLRPPTHDAKALLFCFPYAGAGASMYHRWPRRIGGIEVCAVQLPGRENRLREASYATFGELAEQLAEGLAPYLGVPFGFFGHCGSALIGLETAALLAQTSDHRPHTVVASSMVSPDRTSFPAILELDDAGLADLVADMARARSVELIPELADMAVAVMRSDVEAYRRYQPGPPSRFTSPVTVISWSADTVIPPNETHGWERYGAVRSVVLPGGHWSFLEAPQVLLNEFLRDLDPPALAIPASGRTSQ